MSCRVEAVVAGTAATRLAGPATVFAAFERSCYVEASGVIACLGAAIGRGPLNIVVERFEGLPPGSSVEVDFSSTSIWKPSRPNSTTVEIPDTWSRPWQVCREAKAFLGWLAGAGEPDDALIGLGPGLTPAGDDFVGGAMIALRAFGQATLADRIAAWALPLAHERSNRISRAHLACAAQGEGHEALHGLLASLAIGEPAWRQALARLDAVGHSSGRDAAAGAVLALKGAQCFANSR